MGLSYIYIYIYEFKMNRHQATYIIIYHYIYHYISLNLLIQANEVIGDSSLKRLNWINWTNLKWTGTVWYLGRFTMQAFQTNIICNLFWNVN